MVCQEMKRAAKSRRHTQIHQPFLFDIPDVVNGIAWIQQHLYIAGLDKAANIARFLCITLALAEVFCRLNGPDFTTLQKSLELVMLKMTEQLDQLLPEVGNNPKARLPYIIATFK